MWSDVGGVAFADWLKCPHFAKCPHFDYSKTWTDSHKDRRTRTHTHTHEWRERRLVFLLFRALQTQVSILAGSARASFFNLPVLICVCTHTYCLRVCICERVLVFAWLCVCEQWNRRTVSLSSDVNWWTGLTSCLCSVSLCSFSLLFPPCSLDSAHQHTHTDTPTSLLHFLPISRSRFLY